MWSQGVKSPTTDLMRLNFLGGKVSRLFLTRQVVARIGHSTCITRFEGEEFGREDLTEPATRLRA